MQVEVWAQVSDSWAGNAYDEIVMFCWWNRHRHTKVVVYQGGRLGTLGEQLLKVAKDLGLTKR